jgi:hypothetical protein
VPHAHLLTRHKYESFATDSCGSNAMMKKWVVALTIILTVLLPLYFSSFEVNAENTIFGVNDVTLYAIADAYVNASSPDTNYGLENYLQLSTTSESTCAYMMFDLSSVPSEANLISADLGVYLSHISGYTGSIGTHYCSNDDWTELGITWNSKPAYIETATGTVSYGMFVTYGYDTWNVTIDVRNALGKGKLTEVLVDRRTSSSATFVSREGSSKPKLYLRYTTQPIFTVNLESAQDTGTTNNLGLTTVMVDQPRRGGYAFSLPDAMDIVVGTNLQVKYSGGYTFMRWETSGGVTVSDANAATANVTVSANGTLRAVGNVKRLEYTYDREYSVEHAGFYELEKAGGMLAVRFTPLFSGQLFMTRFYIYEVSSYSSNTVEIHVMDENRQDIITPFERTPTSKGWLDVDLSSYGISVNDGTDFYIGMEWMTDYHPYLGGDDAWTVSDRSWSVNGTDWEETKALTIRAVVGTLCDHAIVEDGKVFQIITESNSTLSDFQFTKEDKKISFNVTGTTGTSGFCNIALPNLLLGGPFNVTFDEQPLGEVLSFDNGTYTELHLTYPQSEHRIEILGTTVVPEFPSAILLQLFTFITIIAVALAKKIRPKALTKTADRLAR